MKEHFHVVSGVIQLATLVDKHIAIWRSGDLGFDSRAGQIGVASGSPPLRRFFGVVLSWRYAVEMGPATRSMCIGSHYYL